MPASKNSASSRHSEQRAELISIVALVAVLGTAAAWWCWSRGYTLYYGDAEAHLNIARRIFDSRTPGGSQIGTVWLPLPHLLIAPFAQVDALWRSGIAGVIPSVAAFATAAGFLFAAACRALGSRPAAFAAVLFFALNPNMLYLQSAPMTEPVFAATLAALLWATLWFRDSQSVVALLCAAAACNAASLTRYEGWFLIPFAALFVWVAARNKRHAILFAALAGLAPAAWLAHNVFYYGNAIEFYNGPYSAQAIYERQVASGVPHPGTASLWIAAQYYFAAAKLVIGTPLVTLTAAGATAALWRRAWWPIALLALPAAFYTWSIHAGGTPIFVPELPPFSRYNTRYALAVLPLAAFATGALVTLIPMRARSITAVLIPCALAVMWFVTADPLSACWGESERGSQARREWTRQAAQYLEAEYRTGDGIVFNFGDLAGVFRQAGIPFRETRYQDNGAAWDEALARPEIQKWALAIEGDPVSLALRQASNFQLARRIIVERAPVIEIYRRDRKEAEPQ